MIALIQRVFEAEVSVNGSIKSKIGEGLIVYIGIDQNDTRKDISYIQNKIISIRLFSKESNKFDLSLKDLNLEILIISNFTLNAKTRNGNRPDFSKAKSPKEAREIYELFVSEMKNILAFMSGEEEPFVDLKTGIRSLRIALDAREFMEMSN